MSNNLSFFAINADAVPRAQKFYETVFGWSFEPWGPPDFYLIETGKGPGALRGGLQERRELARGQKMIGFECTISVANIDQAIRAIEANGGRIAAPKFHIPTVGTVAYFFDTEGNVAGIIQQRAELVTGIVVQVSASTGGIPKLAIPSAELTETGMAGDRCRYPFHGGRRKAILLVTLEGIAELVARGFPVFPGAMGENITTRGLDRRELRLGQWFRVGDARIELTQIRTPCATLDVYGSGIQSAIYDAQVQAGGAESHRWGLSGFYASVIRPGAVSAGEAITLLG